MSGNFGLPVERSEMKFTCPLTRHSSHECWHFYHQDIQQLGEVTHLSQVKLHTQTGEKYERIFVLFANSLVMLSMSPRLSSYQYEVSFALFFSVTSRGLVLPCK